MTSRWIANGLGVLCLLGGVVSLLCFGLLGFGRGGDWSTFGFDFGLMYAGGSTWLQGRNPYNQSEIDQTIMDSGFFAEGTRGGPFSYPPQSAALFVPLALLNFDAAKVCWLTLNILSLLGTIWVLLLVPPGPTNQKRDFLSLSLPAAFILGNPVTTNVVWQGQTPLIVLCAAAIAWYFSRKQQWFAPGVLLGVASIKPQVCLLIMLWLVLERDWKTIGVAMLTALLMSSYPMLSNGPVTTTLAWIERLQTHKQFFANVSGFEHVVGIQSLLSAAGFRAPSLDIVGIFLCLVLWWFRARIVPGNLLAIFMGLTVTLVFVHDSEYVWLMPVFVALWFYSHHNPGRQLALLGLILLFYFPRRIVRELHVPVLSHWRTVVALVLLCWLVQASIQRPAQRKEDLETVP